jgi:ribonuclease I
MNATATTDWYERRDELQPGMIFHTQDGSVVKLDRRVPGDGTDWYVLDFSWSRNWSDEDSRIHPSDLADRVFASPTSPAQGVKP